MEAFRRRHPTLGVRHAWKRERSGRWRASAPGLWFVLVNTFMYHIFYTATLLLGLCRTLKDRHDLHQTTLGIILAHIRDAPFQVGRDDDSHAECGWAASGGRLF